MCGNTRPKLLEVSYGKTSQHNKGNWIFLLSCDPLTPEPMKDAAVSTAPGPVVPPLPQSCRSSTCFQENVSYGALTVLSGRANWPGRRPTTKLSARRPKLNVLSSSFLAVLCAPNTVFSVLSKLNISDWPITSNKQLIRFA